MRELLYFITRRSYVLLFLLLQGIALHLVVRYNNHQRAIFRSSVDRMSNYLKKRSSGVADYFHLRQSNQELHEENALLRSTDARATPIRQGVIDTSSAVPYKYIAATLLQTSSSLSQNYLIMDQGSRSGVRPGDGVISRDGVLGIIAEVSPSYSRAISALHRDSRISAGFTHSDFYGYLEWEPYDPQSLVMYGIPKHAQVSVGDSVIVRNSLIFPDRHPIGVVKEVSVEAGSNFYELVIDVGDRFLRRGSVYIVQNQHRDELLRMDISTQQ